ncbi:hypothetical protein Patl1_14727 [Pistacia atlantica]|uniref:Uncharacterized protein n=1 Tax=Pistacia atlantica TaxID=434234 RepID=A0ACC1AYD4_9ROSI|nr:hypothetical protein Patl1_14727 [Pistacia atlantica]
MVEHWLHHVSYGSLAKARVSWLLEWRAQREAGFTEQRTPPALGSGRITGWCHLDSPWLNGLTQLDHHLFT